jgi:hypothetical protein
MNSSASAISLNITYPYIVANDVANHDLVKTSSQIKLKHLYNGEAVTTANVHKFNVETLNLKTMVQKSSYK